MSFEDRLREGFRSADASVPGERLDWSTTITRARRNKMRFTAITALAAVAAIGVGGYAFVNLDQSPTDPVPLPPAATQADPQTPDPESTVTTGEATPIPARTCSATDLVGDRTFERELDGVPAEVEQMWSDILDAALRCDYEALGALALREGQGFTYSYGAPDGSPADFWRARERQARRTIKCVQSQSCSKGDPDNEYMRFLVQILGLPYCKEKVPNGDVFYIWPRAQCGDRTAEDWDDLEGLYSDAQIDQMRAGDMYYGFRVGITESGDWQYFVAGD